METIPYKSMNQYRESNCTISCHIYEKDNCDTDDTKWWRWCNIKINEKGD